MVFVDSLANFKRCEECDSTAIYAGGTGAWRTKLMCEDCFHLRIVSFTGVVVPLVAEQYSMTPKDVLKVLDANQAEYERMLVEAGDF